MLQLTLLVFLTFSAFGQTGNRQAYSISGVTDAATLEIEGLGSVRLLGVAAPRNQPHAETVWQQATDYCRQALVGKSVRIETDLQKVNSQRQRLVYLFLEDGTFINVELVRLGFAQIASEGVLVHLSKFKAADAEARQNRRGVWGDGSTDTIRAEAKPQPESLRNSPPPRAIETTPIQAKTRPESGVSSEVTGEQPLTTSTTSSTGQLQNSDVVQLVKAGLSTEIVLAKIRTSKSSFDTSPAALQQLKGNGVPDSLILAMIEKGANIPTQETNPPSAEAPEQLSEIPRIFIDAQQGETMDYNFWSGFQTESDLNSLPEIARMIDQKSQEYGFPVVVVFEKEKADFIWLLGREKKWNSRMYTWNLIDRRSSTQLAYGKENWFRNAIKDMLNFAQTGWNALKVQEEKARSGSDDLTKQFPTRVELGPKKIRKGSHKDNFGRVLVGNTTKRMIVKVVALNPDIATLENGASSIDVMTSGGFTNSVTFKILGTGKKGYVTFVSHVIREAE